MRDRRLTERMAAQTFLASLGPRLGIALDQMNSFLGGRSWSPEMGVKDLAPLFDELRRFSLETLEGIEELESKYISDTPTPLGMDPNLCLRDTDHEVDQLGTVSISPKEKLRVLEGGQSDED